MSPSLAAFAGVWSLTRTVEDRLRGRTAHVDGEARFEPEGEFFRYVETGTLRLPDAPPLATRQEHLWRSGAHGIEVLFRDRRPFHAIDAGGDAPRARHLCPPDLYDVAYDFAAWPDWQSTWTVSGPRKAYRMQTLYRRPSPEAG